MRKINWQSGVDINGEKLKYLRAADDLILIAITVRELAKMLYDLDKEKVRFKTNWMKKR